MSFTQNEVLWCETTQVWWLNILSTLWILMAWCFSTRASVATVLNTHPCVSRCLRVNSSSLFFPGSVTEVDIIVHRWYWITISYIILGNCHLSHSKLYRLSALMAGGHYFPSHHQEGTFNSLMPVRFGCNFILQISNLYHINFLWNCPQVNEWCNTSLIIIQYWFR